MEPDAVRAVYDDTTAGHYNERWHSDLWGNDNEHIAKAVERRVVEGVRWLDVGCGTGHYLSRFPGVDRGGIDLSPSMLAQARAANPDARSFTEWDIRVDNPEWHDAHSLVTSTGQAWTYVDTVAQVDQVRANLARWTSPEGTCLVAIQDGLDFTGLRLPYRISTEPGMPDGEVLIKAVIWELIDRIEEDVPGGRVRVHQEMVLPALEHWVEGLAEHFRTVTVETLPHDPEWLPTPRRVVIGTDKRAEGDHGPATVIHHTIDVDGSVTYEGPISELDAHVLATRGSGQYLGLAAEHDRAIWEAERAALQEERAAWQEERVELERKLAVATHEADWLRDTYGHLPPPSDGGSVHLGATPTRTLLTEAGRRLNPVPRARKALQR